MHKTTLTAFIVMMIGCSSQTPTSSKSNSEQAPTVQAPTADLAADLAEISRSWQQFVADVKSPQSVARAKQAWLRRFPEGFFSLTFVEDDVKKTDSLKAPNGVIGVIKMRAMEGTRSALNNPLVDRGYFSEREYQLNFAYNDAQWQFLDGSEKLVRRFPIIPELEEQLGREDPVDSLMDSAFFPYLFAVVVGGPNQGTTE